MITACSYRVDDKGLSTAGQTESPAVHTLWLYVLGLFLKHKNRELASENSSKREYSYVECILGASNRTRSVYM
jgi:hypothetical protein